MIESNLCDKGTFFYKKKSIRCGTRLLNFETPVVMGILNLSPDSFYAGSRYLNDDVFISEVEKMLDCGASILDIGAMSTRPGSKAISEKEEISKLIPALTIIKQKFPDAIISVDTYRSSVSKIAVDNGADIINDISGGTMDKKMFETIAELDVPYVLMHIQGTPETMQINPVYNDVVKEILDFLVKRTKMLIQLGVKDIIVDPGFGFGKSLKDNYCLLHHLDRFIITETPLLVGLSRKSFINKVLNTSPEQALNGTTVLNTIALLKGADILRVHDVKEAVETIKLVNAYNLQI